MCDSRSYLVALPEAVLLLIAGDLTADDLRGLQATCSYLCKCLASVWRQLLKADFGLSVQVGLPHRNFFTFLPIIADLLFLLAQKV